MKPKFKMGQRVYHVLSGEDGVGIVTGILYRPTWLLYFVTWKDRNEQTAFEIELSEQPVRDFAD